jgi:uncharacterized protein (TIGR00369 family)
VCGQEHERGLRARFYVEDGGCVQVRFTPDSTQTGYDDVVHGAVVAGLMDELLGWLVVLQTGRMCYTAELTIRFLRPLRIGRVYTGSTKQCVDQGRYWESRGTLADEEGTIYAKAHGKYFLLSEEQTTTVVSKMTYLADDLPVLRGMLNNR